MVDAKVIVMEPSDSQARTLEAVLKFLDLSPVRFHDLAELGRKTEGAHDWLALIVGAETVQKEGPELVARLRALAQPLPVIYVSSDGLPRIAETSGDLAWLHLELPVKQRRLSAVLNQAQNVRNGHPTQPGTYRFRPSGTSPAMRAIHRLVEQVAPYDTNVLILGESGTGKEMVARALHEGSPRRAAPFLAINCGAIPENLIESTLFGHERGSFTGADRAAKGYFRDADGGTLLLDEIGELPLGLQSKLLRVLEEGAVTPVGTTSPSKVDVRIVAATNRDLEQQAATSEFRQDLFFRLNIVRIDLPPLRDRKDDLPLLTRFFLDEICRTNAFEPREIDPSLLDAFGRYDWPGNVRELRNALESLVILSGKRLLAAEDLPEKFFRTSETSIGGDGASAAAENPESELNLTRLSKQTIMKALEACRGNRTEAAKQLGISRRTLHRRLNEFGLRD